MTNIHITNGHKENRHKTTIGEGGITAWTACYQSPCHHCRSGLPPQSRRFSGAQSIIFSASIGWSIPFLQDRLQWRRCSLSDTPCRYPTRLSEKYRIWGSDLLAGCRTALPESGLRRIAEMSGNLESALAQPPVPDGSDAPSGTLSFSACTS